MKTRVNYRRGSLSLMPGNVAPVLTAVLMVLVIVLLVVIQRNKQQPVEQVEAPVVEMVEIEIPPPIGVEVPEVPELVQETVPEVVPEIIPEPEIVAEVPEPEKPEVDLLLEQQFPDPSFMALEQIVQNWNLIPAHVLPARVRVNSAVVYRAENNAAQLREEAGHEAVPVAVTTGTVTLGHISDPRHIASMPMDQTDIRDVITHLYEERKREAIAAVIAKREANRDQAVAYLEKKSRQGDDDDDDDAITAFETEKTFAGDFSPRRYGSRYRGNYWPETKNGKDDNVEHEMPMGPLSGAMAVIYDRREARIVSLWNRGAGARAGLQVGDLLVKVDGKTLAPYGRRAADGGTGVPEQLGMAMLDAQQSRRPLVLSVKRDSADLDIQIDLPEAPAFSRTFPDNCARSQALSWAAAEYLVSEQRSDGTWGANDYTQAWCGLALLSTGDPRYSRAIRNAARALADKYDLGARPSEADLTGYSDAGQGSNWFVTMTGIFLAEYYLATGDSRVLGAIEHCSLSMKRRIEAGTGRFGHNRTELPYEQKGLVVINIHAHLMWALESMIQGQDSYDWTVWNLSYDKAITSSFGDSGEIGYNFSARGGDQSGSRTGAMLTALAMTNKKRSDQRDMGRWLNDNHPVFPNVHAMTFIGPIYGFMGLKNSNARHYRRCLDEYRWMFSLVQPSNYSHGAYYYGDRGNSGGDEYCNKRLVGNIMAIMVLNSHRNDTLWIYGNRQKNWMK